MTEEEFNALFIEGIPLFTSVVGELNTISGEYIRLDEEEYRREPDYREICIALALLKRKLNQ